MPEQDEPIAVGFWFQQEVLEGNYQAALDRLSSSRFESFEYYPKAYLEGVTYDLMGEAERARGSFETARIWLEERLKEPAAFPFQRGILGLAYARLGRKEEAIRQGLQGVEMLPVSKDAVSGPFTVFDLAQIYTLVGEHDAALDQIEYLLSIPAGCAMSVAALRIDPRWDPLRDHPRFQKLLEDYGKKERSK
jgi:tetratricopeptide (TPR) repeat protein